MSELTPYYDPPEGEDSGFVGSVWGEEENVYMSLGWYLTVMVPREDFGRMVDVLNEVRLKIDSEDIINNGRPN